MAGEVAERRLKELRSLFVLYRLDLTIAALILAVGYLGYSGFAELGVKRGTHPTALENHYLAIQLFMLESGAVGDAINWKLQVARFLAPVIAAVSIVRASWAAFYGVFRQYRSGHVIVCGLGEKGVTLVEQLRGAGERVVVIERDEHNDDLVHCRKLGALVQIGDASDEWLLRRVRIGRAKLLIAVTGEDGDNVEIAMLAHAINRDRTSGSLRCVIHVANPYLQASLMEHDIFNETDDPFELEIFNSLEVCARLMLRQNLALDRSYGIRRRHPHLLVLGLGWLGERVVLRAVKDWRIDRGGSEEKLRITILDYEVERRRVRLLANYPDVARDCSLEFVDMEIDSPSFSRGDFLTPGAGDNPVTSAYICLGDDATSLNAALTLHRLLPMGEVPIAASMKSDSGLGTLLGSRPGVPGMIPGVRVISLADVASSLDLILDVRRELLAQTLHQGYLMVRKSEAGDIESGATDDPWERLEPSMRESNRRAAAYIDFRLREINCRMVPTGDGSAIPISLTAEEIDTLARLEHERWMRERGEIGWRRGDVKDPVAKTHPLLVPWSELPEPVRQDNRADAEHLPAILAKADYEIRRMD